jgi:hypothetical protein
MLAEQKIKDDHGPQFCFRGSFMGTGVVEGVGPLAGNPNWEVAQKVAASASFQKSPRMQELLLDICERALLNRPDDLREALIGRRIFGRSDDYNPSEDNIVRVEVRRLRRRLEQYAESEGVRDSIVISIPKGSYIPNFEVREVCPTVETAPSARVAADTQNRSYRRWWLWPAAIAILIAGVALWWLSGQMRHATADPTRELMSPAERAPLWPLLFNRSQNTMVICADSALVVAQALRGSQVPLESYIARDYTGNGRAVPEHAKGVLKELAGWQMTDVADVRLVDRIHRTNPDDWSQVSIQTARTARIEDFARGNVILLGSARSNPWNNLFDQHRNLRIEWDDESKTAIVRDRASPPGQPDVYKSDSHVEYALITFVPNLRSLGNVLMIAGTNGKATEVAGEYLTNRETYRRLMKTISDRNHAELPYFEVLLKTGMLAGAPRDVELITTRILSAGPARK